MTKVDKLINFMLVMFLVNAVVLMGTAAYWLDKEIKHESQAFELCRSSLEATWRKHEHKK